MANLDGEVNIYGKKESGKTVFAYSIAKYFLDEFEKYKDCFDIMDGQHRLFSFLEEKRKIEDNINYDLTFNMYITPTLRTRRLIFKNTNEEQKQVPSNLLLWFRKQLNMLSDKEKNYHTVVELLNKESCSPLKGKIIMGAEKIVGGLKAEQIINGNKSSYPYLGVSMLNIEDARNYINYRRYITDNNITSGVIVIDIEKDSVAYKNGMESGDIITQIKKQLC